jgi:hypothetical protein
MAWSAAISWIVLRPLIASMATLALNSGLWVRRLLNSFGEGCAYGGSGNDRRAPHRFFFAVGEAGHLPTRHQGGGHHRLDQSDGIGVCRQVPKRAVAAGVEHSIEISGIDFQVSLARRKTRWPRYLTKSGVRPKRPQTSYS